MNIFGRYIYQTYYCHYKANKVEDIFHDIGLFYNLIYAQQKSILLLHSTKLLTVYLISIKLGNLFVDGGSKFLVQHFLYTLLTENSIFHIGWKGAAYHKTQQSEKVQKIFYQHKRGILKLLYIMYLPLVTSFICIFVM